MTIRSPRALIEQVSPDHFQMLARRVGCGGPFPDALSKGHVSASVLLVLGLGEQPRRDFDEIAERVGALGDDRGLHAILIAAGCRRERFEAAMAGHQGPIDSALWCLLEHGDMFLQAEAVFHNECRRERAHDFVGTFLTDPSPTLVSAALPTEALEAGLVGVYRLRGDRCESVLLQLDDRLNPPARRVEISIHRKGRPVTSHIFEGEEAVRKRLIPVMPDTISFDPESGIVEVISQHGDTHRERLATTFCDLALGREPPARVERMRVILDALRQPRSFESSLEHGVRTVRLFEIRTKVGKCGFETVRADDGEDVYQFMQRRGTLHLLNGSLARAAFEIWFSDGQSNSKGRAHKLVLAGDNAISFPKWSPSRQEAGKRLLREWGLIEE